MNYDLTDCIKDSFDDTMKTHMESDNYKEEGWEINKLYFELRNILDIPEYQKKLDTLFNALEERGIATAKEAYHRGVVLGMSHSKRVLGDMEREC